MNPAFAGLREAGVPVSRACALTGRARATHYRHARGPVRGPRLPRAVPGNEQALSAAERESVLALINSEAYTDLSAGQIWARELDAGSYLCSASTMYRIARAAGQTRERRRQAAHPAKTKPELLADGPSQIWTWDITKLRGPARGVFYQLYVLIDIYSRFNPSWIISPVEDSLLATDFIAEAIDRNGTAPHTVHADRGTSMTSKPVSALLADLGVTRSHSRPHVSNDNPYSEAQFKTLKYLPEFPASFASLAHARQFCADFFPWYNDQHRHGGLGLHTAADVHYGRAAAVRAGRAQVLTAAYLAHPERFVLKPPTPPGIPAGSWINPPDHQQEETAAQ